MAMTNFSMEFFSQTALFVFYIELRLFYTETD
jgi:hypothetical protein